MSGPQITEAGVYDIPADVYHADPVPGGSLSSGGARRLLPPSCPALFRYWVTNGQAPTEAFDFGHAAHLLVLGAGPPLAVVDADDWRTKAARAERKGAYQTGAVPILRADYEIVQAMAAAIKAHPIARALFNPDAGKPEQSLFWVDQASGVWCRARLDWLPNYTVLPPQDGRTRQDFNRLIIPDYKTCRSADPDALSRDIYNFGYHQQAAWYLDAVKATCPAGAHPDFQPAFIFVCQEKTPPYLVTVAEVDQLALRVGQELNRQAIDLYAECVASGNWPGYSDDVELIGLPAWVERRYEGATW